MKTGENTRRPERRQERILGLKSHLAASLATPKPTTMFVCWTTLADRLAADRLAAEVIAHGLAACVQIEGPITSHYHWQGQAERAEEFRLCFKALPAQVAALEAYVLRHHPYDTPEWLVVRAEYVGEKYLSWAKASSTFPTFHTSHPPL